MKTNKTLSYQSSKRTILKTILLFVFSVFLFAQNLAAQSNIIKIGAVMPLQKPVRIAVAFERAIVPRFTVEIGLSFSTSSTIRGVIRRYDKGLWLNPRYFFLKRKRRVDIGVFAGPILTLDQNHWKYIPDREKLQSETFVATGIMTGFQVEIIDRLWVQNEFSFVRQFYGTRRVFLNRGVYDQYPVPTEFAFFAVLTVGYSIGRK